VAINEKLPDQLKTDFLDSLIVNKIRESLHLDYKDKLDLEFTEKNKVKISINVSAFANSDGGRIIYGMSEDNGFPTGYSGIRESGKIGEWLNQVILDKIQPRIEGVRVLPITINNEETAFLVDIPSSYTAHQASDRKYYRRTEFNCEPMYDYEVKQTINRGKEPILILDSPQQFLYSTREDNEFFELRIINNGKKTAKSIRIFLYLPKNLLYKIQGRWEKLVGHQRKHYECDVIHLDFESETSFLHPGGELWLSKIEPLKDTIFIRTQTSLPFTKLTGYYEIFAEDMSPVMGTISFALGIRGIGVSVNRGETNNADV
jgi:hypothetical protein